MANAAGFQHLNGAIVTVLSSKTSQRYRLQSDNLSSLWILTQDTENRLQRFHSGSRDGALQCTYTSSLPMHEYFTEVETHFHKRNKLAQLQEQLGQRCGQFRAIERRLLARFKDKTPSPLTNLDTLLEGTFRQILLVTDAIDECQEELRQSACNLACITNLILLLLRLSTSLPDEEVAKLKAALTSIVQGDQQQVGGALRETVGVTHRK